MVFRIENRECESIPLLIATISSTSIRQLSFTFRPFEENGGDPMDWLELDQAIAAFHVLWGDQLRKTRFMVLYGDVEFEEMVERIQWWLPVSTERALLEFVEGYGDAS
jgi:hypothetical protein